MLPVVRYDKYCSTQPLPRPPPQPIHDAKLKNCPEAIPTSNMSYIHPSWNAMTPIFFRRTYPLLIPGLSDTQQSPPQLYLDVVSVAVSFVCLGNDPWSITFLPYGKQSFNKSVFRAVVVVKVFMNLYRCAQGHPFERIELQFLPSYILVQNHIMGHRCKGL